MTNGDRYLIEEVEKKSCAVEKVPKYHNSKEEHVLRNCVAKMLYLRGPINK
jgi:hypothetical protein